MNLRRQLALLIAGIFLIPLAVLGNFAFRYALERERPDPLLSIFRAVEHSSEALLQDGKVDMVALPEPVELLIWDSVAESPVYASPSLLNGGSLQERTIAAVVSELRGSGADVTLLNVDIGGHMYQYVFSLPRNFYRDVSNNVLIAAVALDTTLAIMLAFAVVISLLIIKSLNDKIATLAKATERIAAGDLDTAITSPGKDTFASLTHSLDQMRQQLKAEKEHRTRLFMNLSHDLKTPLASIDGYIDALLEGFGDEEAKRRTFLGIMRDKSAILSRRIASLVDYAKLTTSDWELATEGVSIREFLEDFIELHTPEAQMQGFSVESSLDVTAEQIVELDRQLLFRALENIFDNAVKFSDDRKRLLFSLTAGGEGLELTIQNYGAGVQEEHVQRIFEPFFRAASDRNKAGNGLGLASAKHILEAHGWSVTAQSVVNETTRIVISIPAMARSLGYKNKYRGSEHDRGTAP